MNFAAYLAAKGFRTAIEKPSEKMTDHVHNFVYEIADESTPGSVDFTKGALLATDPQWDNIHGDGDNPTINFHVESIKVDVFGDQFTYASLSEKVKFFQGAYLRVKTAGNVQNIPLYQAFDEPVSDLRDKAAPDGTAIGLIQSNAGLELEDPASVNLRTDDLEIVFTVNPPKACTLVVQVEGYSISQDDMPEFVDGAQVKGGRVITPGIEGAKQRHTISRFRSLRAGKLSRARK